MPASTSLSIPAIVDRVTRVVVPDPAALAPSLRQVLAEVIDPRKRRGVRHGLAVVLTAAMCAVVAGARSFVAVAEWAADLTAEIETQVGTERRCPSESTFRRLRSAVLESIKAGEATSPVHVGTSRLIITTAPSLARPHLILARTAYPHRFSMFTLIYAPPGW